MNIHPYKNSQIVMMSWPTKGNRKCGLHRTTVYHAVKSAPATHRRKMLEALSKSGGSFDIGDIHFGRSDGPAPR